MITSTKNPKVKWIRSLQTSARIRRDSGVFVVEGVRLVEEALKSGWEIKLVIHEEQIGPRGESVLMQVLERGCIIETVTHHVMRAASDTQTPQGILAVVAIQGIPLPQDLDLLLILDTIRDPGNLGTILRTSAAAGMQAVFLSQESVDPFSPKVVRAGMGAHFRVPVMKKAWDDIYAIIHAAALHTWLADAGAGVEYTSAEFKSPTALIIGGEASGAGLSAQSLAVDRVHIPMAEGAESLNAAVAAGILCFEVYRQRRGVPG